jgi:hypothetical protein
MDYTEKLRLRLFKQNFFELLVENNGCRYAAIFLDEFKKASGNLSKRTRRRLAADASMLVGRVSSWLFLDGLLSSSPPPLHQLGRSCFRANPTWKSFFGRINRIAMNQETG